MSATLSLQGKVVFIQGGSRGIGAAIAKRLAREGCCRGIYLYVASADKAEALGTAKSPRLAAKLWPSRPTVPMLRLCSRLYARQSTVWAIWIFW